MNRLLAISLLLGGFLMACSPARAQEAADTTTEVPADRPFVPGGMYDKPYLTNLLGRTAIGGYAEAHTRWVQVDGIREELGFELRRWNIFTSTQVNEFVRIGAELEFEELGEEINLEFAAIDLAIHPSLTLRAGAILSPLGRFNLAHDSPRNEFTDRPLVSTEVVGTALTEPGLGALGVFGLGGAGRFTYEIYAVNGFHEGLIDDSPDGTRIPVGKKNFEDGNNSPAAVGRVTWSPAFGYELGISGHHGAYNTFTLDGEHIEERYDLTIGALDFEAALAGVTLSGEAVAARLDIAPGLHDIYASAQNGLFIEATRPFGEGWIQTMPNSLFVAKTRYDFVDFDADLIGDSERRFAIGVNFRPSADAVLKLDYFRGRVRDRFNNPGDAAGILFSIATYF